MPKPQLTRAQRWMVAVCTLAAVGCAALTISPLNHRYLWLILTGFSLLPLANIAYMAIENHGYSKRLLTLAAIGLVWSVAVPSYAIIHYGSS